MRYSNDFTKWQYSHHLPIWHHLLISLKSGRILISTVDSNKRRSSAIRSIHPIRYDRFCTSNSENVWKKWQEPVPI